ncbi:hypothetical protein [Lederbergia citri]|uniref:Galactose-1-phosphate uridylyltransferase n=1 Tax=Lederbergia citri TaxID=2833580 RepID=A0A942TCM9_9BACI|nr:hypothetical protein [Lederbergia citri]MBS4194341.1 hypothetical protein [Lederbergia citri]
MTIEFIKNEEWFTFLDGEGNKVERKTEIRFDPLTGESSRLVFDPGLVPTPPDYTEAAEQTSGKNCPFCSENILKMTPLFPKEITDEGRIFYGDAIVFPNLFPYSKHNGVVVFSGQHYVRLEEFTTSMIKDAFMAAQKYIEKVIETDNKAKCISINWNYLPYSGGSILHPHLHVIISDSPTNYQANVFEKVNDFKQETGLEYFSELYRKEKETAERWIGEKGSVAWLHAFSPKSHNDFIGIFTKSATLLDITEQNWTDFAEGLKSIFAALSEQGYASFNMSMALSTNETNSDPIHVRLIPRLTIGNLGTSDISYFQALHQEYLSYKAPEKVAKLARRLF